MKAWKYVSPGIPDRYFIKKNAPMTKEEIRVLIISKLRLRENSIVYDIGAGVGSVSVEAALVARKGIVYAIEKEKARAAHIKKNTKNFGVKNVKVIVGEGSEIIENKNLEKPDRIFIGGSGGNIERILDASLKKIKSSGVIVASAVKFETLSAILKKFEEKKIKYELGYVSIAKERNGILKMLTSVFLVSAKIRAS